MKKISFAVLGGDSRQFSLIERLLDKGACVAAYGLPCEGVPSGAACYEDWRAAVSSADVVILPLPVSPDGRVLHMPLSEGEEPPRLRDVFDGIKKGTLLAGGRFSPALRELAQEFGYVPFDYAKSEMFEQRNAIPTAEGAIAILMEKMPCTVSGMSVAVTGYGRVGKALAHLLGAMGARVTVGARKPLVLAEAAAAGHRIRRLGEEETVAELAQGNAVVFNTVPHWIFTEAVLKDIPRKTLLIDLASAPGGIDAQAAKKLGIPVIWALSLPGKYAPQSAGEIIADTVLAYMKEEGII